MKPLSSDRSDNNRWDLKSCISAIAGEWFPYDRWTFFSPITAIVAIKWKPGLIYRNNYPPFLLNCYLYALQTYRKHSPKLWLLLVSWLNSHQKIISIQTPQRDPVHKIYKVFLQIDRKYTHLSGWYLWLQKGHTSVDVYSHFKLE